MPVDAAQPQLDLEADPVVDQQIGQMRTKIQRLEEENRSLRDKIEGTNDGISSYISEMSTMLDSQEIVPLSAENTRTGGVAMQNERDHEDD